MDVRDDDSATVQRSRPADAMTHCDSHAGGFALKWPKHELPIFQEIKASPVEIGKCVEDERNRVRGIGNQVALTGEQSTQFTRQMCVICRLIGKVVALACEAHARSIGKAKTSSICCASVASMTS